MKSIALFALQLFISSHAFANEWCENANVEAVTLSKLDQSSAKNLCQVNATDLTPVELRILERIQTLHFRIAELFQSSTDNLFTKPIRVDLHEYTFGQFISTGGESGIDLGVFPGDEFDFDDSVYLHELTHSIASSKNETLPETLAGFQDSTLFSEGFSDLVSLVLTQTLFSPKKDMPNCLARIRYITASQSYRLPEDYFTNFSESRILKCCESVRKTSKDVRYLDLCGAASEFFASYTFHRTPLNVDTLKATTSIDEHQVAIPLLSFFKDFSQKSGQTLRDVFEGIVFQTHEGMIDRCAFEETILNQYRATLPSKDQAIYDSLFAKHTIDKGFKLARNLCEQSKK